MSLRLFIDVSEYIRSPIPTGIQRTLFSLARHWPNDVIQAEFGFCPGPDLPYTVVPLTVFQNAATQIFESQIPLTDGGQSISQQLTRYLSNHASSSVSPHEIADTYDSYLLPEVTFTDYLIDTFALCAKRMKHRCFAIVYDILPQTHPSIFPGHSHAGWTDRFFLTLCKFDNIAFISAESQRIFESRFRRSSPVPNSVVISLGADSLGQGTSPVPAETNFLVVCTVEPRKRHTLILDTFEQLWSDGNNYHLRFLGIPGWHPPQILNRFRQQADELDLFDWQESVSDVELREAIRSATGMVFVSELEGYGLPPVEALALGCPVIVATGIPALEDLPENGQIRLESVTEDTLAAAVKIMADPTENANLRESITHLDLPTWEGVISDLAAWIHHTIKGG